MAEGGEVSFSSGSAIVFDFFCELCIDDNKQVEAEGYCVDCREYLCGSCFSGHGKSRLTRHHVLQDKENMPKDTLLSTDRLSKDITTKCKTHSGEPVKYYCKSHGELGCANCLATDHRNCPDVESVLQKSENILNSEDYKDFLTKLQSIQRKSRDIVACARENKTVSQRCCMAVVSSVRQLKEEVIVMLDEVEQNIVALAEEMKLEDDERMEFVVEDCKVMSEKIEQLSAEFESLQSSKCVCQLYINMRETEGEIKALQENLVKLDGTNAVRTFTFEPNAKLTSVLRTPDALGKISQQGHRVSTTSPTITTDLGKITATKVADVGVISKSDTCPCGCCITGSAVVSNNRLILADLCNKNVKLVDTHANTLLSALKVSSRPWDITVINRNQTAVTLSDCKKILLIRVLYTLVAEREITVQGKCYGVAYNQDRLLVTFVGKNPRMEIIDLRGNVIRTIENDSDGSNLFQNPWFVCVSKDGEIIYVSDRDRNTVTSLTFDGVVKSVYKDEELIRPYKVCTDHHGNVYVCGRHSRNVHMITADCKKVKVILTQADGLNSYVLSVSHCQDTNRLFIGMWGNHVKVYQLPENLYNVRSIKRLIWMQTV